MGKKSDKVSDKRTVLMGTLVLVLTSMLFMGAKFDLNKTERAYLDITEIVQQSNLQEETRDVVLLGQSQSSGKAGQIYTMNFSLKGKKLTAVANHDDMKNSHNELYWKTRNKNVKDVNKMSLTMLKLTPEAVSKSRTLSDAHNKLSSKMFNEIDGEMYIIQSSVILD